MRLNTSLAFSSNFDWQRKCFTAWLEQNLTWLVAGVGVGAGGWVTIVCVSAAERIVSTQHRPTTLDITLNKNVRKAFWLLQLWHQFLFYVLVVSVCFLYVINYFLLLRTETTIRSHFQSNGRHQYMRSCNGSEIFLFMFAKNNWSFCMETVYITVMWYKENFQNHHGNPRFKGVQLNKNNPL